MSATSQLQVAASATIAAGARLHPGVQVGANVVVEADVEVGAGTVLLPGTVLLNGSRVGAGCKLGPYAVVGGEPMDTGFHGEPSHAVIEDGVELREFVSVHRATGEGNATRVGAGSLVMSYAHVSHNGDVGRGCTLTTHVQLGGHVQVGDHAVIGAGSMMHQFGRVGAYAMFGAGSAANRDVLPYSMARGNPALHYRLNRVGLLRHGVVGERYAVLEAALRHVRRRELDALEELAAVDAGAAQILEFVRSSRRGISRFVSGG
ncbi:MAG: acyl-ACP--UDP-N-acetylglucosamine O-acyltransferase [Trueperaceae bacterium]